MKTYKYIFKDVKGIMYEISLHKDLQSYWTLTVKKSNNNISNSLVETILTTNRVLELINFLKNPTPLADRHFNMFIYKTILGDVIITDNNFPDKIFIKIKKTEFKNTFSEFLIHKALNIL